MFPHLVPAETWQLKGTRVNSRRHYCYLYLRDDRRHAGYHPARTVGSLPSVAKPERHNRVCASTGLILASLAAGPLLDNEGQEAQASFSALASSPSRSSLLPRSPGFRSIVLLLFLLGVGGGIMVTGANALASDVGEAHRATALNLANLFFGLGALATPFIAANLFGRNWVRLCYTSPRLRWSRW